MSEGYKDGNPKTIYGEQKTPMDLVPPSAIRTEARVFKHGADKYGAYNWRDKTVSSSVYYAAALRHLTAWWDGENRDPDSGEHHLAHVRACMAIVIDAAGLGRLNDDRPPRADLAALLNALEDRIPPADDEPTRCPYFTGEPPSWDDAPDAAKWLAQEGDGRYVWFDEGPVIFKGGYWATEEGHIDYEDGRSMSNPNWTLAIEPRPETHK